MRQENYLLNKISKNNTGNGSLIKKATRDENSLTVAINSEGNILLQDIPLNVKPTNDSGEGYLLTSSNNDFLYIENHNYFVNLKEVLEGIKSFLQPFSSGGNIGTSPQGAVMPDPALITQAKELNTQIDNLINKLP